MAKRVKKPYPAEKLDEWEDNGTMPESRDALAEAVIGHRIVAVERVPLFDRQWYYSGSSAVTLTLDDGTKVQLAENGDCCAYTEVQEFLLHPELVDHVIVGVGTTDGFNTWHIYADAGDVLNLSVGWSCGNPFYYGYGFSINVTPPEGDNA
jgi:hypothetical protein